MSVCEQHIQKVDDLNASIRKLLEKTSRNTCLCNFVKHVPQCVYVVEKYATVNVLGVISKNMYLSPPPDRNAQRPQ
uniref:SWIM-type domain-containing protein n=1 Tax=Strongyloides venezuelensis TaxID=75913 RepID=A0A0K0G0W3_STRVS